MPARGPPRPRGSPTPRGSAVPGARPGRRRRGLWCLSRPEPPQPRSPRSAFAALPSPCIFTGGYKSTAEPAAPAPRRRRSVLRIFPNFSWGQIHLRAPEQPPLSQAGTSRGTGGRSHKPGRFLPPRGTFLATAIGLGAERAALAPGAAGAVAVPGGAAAATPRGWGSSLWPRIPHADGGRHRPRGGEVLPPPPRVAFY